LPAAVRSPAPREPADASAGAEFDRFINDRLAAGSEDLYAESLALMERRLLTRILQHTNGNQVQAARLLGITRGSLRTKLRALGRAPRQGREVRPGRPTFLGRLNCEGVEVASGHAGGPLALRGGRIARPSAARRRMPARAGARDLGAPPAKDVAVRVLKLPPV